MKNLNKYYIPLGIIAAGLIVFGGILGIISGIYIFVLMYKHSKQGEEGK